MLPNELVVEDEKFITTTGTGVEGALRVVELLHGEPWARVVALNMEFEPLPEDERTPRGRLADMNLPTSVYGAWSSDWRLLVHDDDKWQGEVRLLLGPARRFELQVEVASGDGG